MHQRNVGLLHLSLGKLFCQFAMCFIVLGHDDESTGFFVETMDDAWAHLATYGGQRRKMMQQYADTIDALAKGAKVLGLKRTA
jgi:hypothetical protein